MPDLQLISGPPTLPTTYQDAVETAKDYLRAEKAEATRRAYRSDARIFAHWCEARGLIALPATSETLTAFLADQARGGTKLSTLRRRVAAITYAHEAAGHEPPQGRLVKSVLQGIARTHGAARQ